MNDTIEQLAADFSLQLGDLTGEWPGFTPQSLANLDALFDSWRALASAYEDDLTLAHGEWIFAAACFVGEVLRRSSGAAWDAPGRSLRLVDGRSVDLPSLVLASVRGEASLAALASPDRAHPPSPDLGRS